MLPLTAPRVGAVLTPYGIFSSTRSTITPD
jgi:hypothetical protein